MFYSCDLDVPDREILQRLVVESIEYWNEDIPVTGLFLAPGWSNDWHHFRYLNRWVLPYPRWGHRDPAVDVFDLYETTSATIRYRHHLLGDLKPILYHEKDHAFVIFRVGQRLFLHWLDGKDGNNCLCALPMALRDILHVGINDVVNEALLRYDCSEVSRRTPESLFSAFSGQVEFIESNMDVFEGQSISRSIMQTWDDDTWTRMLKKVWLTL